MGSNRNADPALLKVGAANIPVTSRIGLWRSRRPRRCSKLPRNGHANRSRPERVLTGFRKHLSGRVV